jgi:hypothetical protein
MDGSVQRNTFLVKIEPEHSPILAGNDFVERGLGRSKSPSFFDRYLRSTHIPIMEIE